MCSTHSIWWIIGNSWRSSNLESGMVTFSITSITGGVQACHQRRSVHNRCAIPNKPVMMAQWENECISLSVFCIARVQYPAVAEYLKGFFHDWSHTPLPTVALKKPKQTCVECLMLKVTSDCTSYFLSRTLLFAENWCDSLIESELVHPTSRVF